MFLTRFRFLVIVAVIWRLIRSKYPWVFLVLLPLELTYNFKGYKPSTDYIKQRPIEFR